MMIEILGPGCFKCQKLEEVTKQAVSELGIDAFINHITDYNGITNRGIMITPALVVDGVVKVAGKVPSLEEVKIFLGK
ncbi:MAG TPA: thioredoxin family protein [Spirochaetota bacterium]|nr:thioredoxin family protein [Spirochaetota bacterium]HPC42336.1 thioredoxin family protein [Spirochaetota bacterium]HPL17850.1 thioredoxin family protein [Spirochaetota bacterium]HQF10215.1 thioredoxin family protein [Spirochaetota bacterium]HQH99361.1 thioredoxin family protein [Spirochaetota bacterium]